VNLIILDAETGGILYGHQLARRIISRGVSVEAQQAEGIEAEAYIAYVGHKFDYVKEVRALVESHAIDPELLEAVSDAIELNLDDVEAIRRLQAAAS
jgi:hypothetical protein